MMLATVQSTLIATSTMVVNAIQDDRGLAARQVLGGPGPVSEQTSSTATLPVTSPNTPTGISTQASPTPSTPTLIMNTPSTLMTCQPANITWEFSGSNTASMTLLITDEYVSQSTLATAPPTVLWTLAENADASLGTWEWPTVNLTSGYYMLQGAVTGGSSEQTSPFFIATGSDTSCLPASSSGASSPTGTSIPSTGSSKKTNAGAIAGGVVGGVVVLLVALFALLFVRKQNNAARSRRGNWGGLAGASTDSQAAFAKGGRSTGQSASGGVHKPTESTGGMLNDIGPAIATATVTSSQDDLDSGEDEKFSSPTSPSVLHDIQPVAYSPTHAHRTSASSQVPNYSRPRTSTQQSDTSISSATIHRGVPTADIADYHRADRSPSLPVSSRSTNNSPRAADFSSAEMIPMGRSASSQSAMGARRASRKPVPQYDASELEQQSSSSNAELPSFDFEPNQTLNHKPSNGSVGQMHYLIPDMPPPSRD